MAKTQKVAVFGLGSMGRGMANAALRAGLVTHGFDVRADAVSRFVDSGGKAGPVVAIFGSCSRTTQHQNRRAFNRASGLCPGAGPGY